jgi:hypothetical protein
MRLPGHRHEGQYQQINDEYDPGASPRTRLGSRNWDELTNRARELGIKGAARMSKKELVHAIRTGSERGGH